MTTQQYGAALGHWLRAHLGQSIHLGSPWRATGRLGLVFGSFCTHWPFQKAGSGDGHQPLGQLFQLPSPSPCFCPGLMLQADSEEENWQSSKASEKEISMSRKGGCFQNTTIFSKIPEYDLELIEQCISLLETSSAPNGISFKRNLEKHIHN